VKNQRERLLETSIATTISTLIKMLDEARRRDRWRDVEKLARTLHEVVDLANEDSPYLEPGSDARGRANLQSQIDAMRRRLERVEARMQEVLHK